MILYYTHNHKDRKFMERVYNFHRKQADRVGQSFRAVVKAPFQSGDIIVPFDPSLPKYADIYVRILRGLDGVPDSETVYLAEDDTLYSDGRFQSFDDPFRVFYNLEIIYLTHRGFLLTRRGGIALSQMCGTASAIRFNIQKKMEENLRGGFSFIIEPCQREDVPYVSGSYPCNPPSIDFRGVGNTTWSVPDDAEVFQELDGWPCAGKMWNDFVM